MSTLTVEYPQYKARSQTRSQVIKRCVRVALLTASLVAALPGNAADDIASRKPSPSPEFLYVGDIGGDGSFIRRVNLTNGETIVIAYDNAALPNGLHGPMGLLVMKNRLIVSNQNMDETGTTNGDLMQFSFPQGDFDRYVVSYQDKGAPFAPQGIVFGGGSNGWPHRYQPDSYYVADAGTRNNSCEPENAGSVRVYNEQGAFLYKLELERRKFPFSFYPRGVVFGPDGMLYVAARGCPASDTPDQLSAYLLKFDPYSRRLVEVIATDRDVPRGVSFHRPEGLVFDKQGYLWVTSFRNAADPNDVDRILKFNVRTGKVIDQILLWEPGHPRAYSQAIIFGPGGRLFVPITGNDPTTTGQIRSYDIRSKTYGIVAQSVRDGGALESPWFPIFEKSDPATLSYHGK